MIQDTQHKELDELDRTILRTLQQDGRISNAELARQIHLSPPATHARLRRLEEEGYIQHYTAVLNREKLGFDLLCFIHVSMQLHQLEQMEQFRSAIRQMPEVLECHHMTGEYDYLLKIAVHNREALERFVIGRLTPLAGLARIHTSLVFTEVKSTTALSLE
jgi:Lrp/AsnC family leucine-responsive transcriptional regulator